MFNIVELIADKEEQSFNQKCKYGNLVDKHAVYCHNSDPKAPRKCKHTWFWGENSVGNQDEDCPLFERNQNYKTF